MRFNFSSAFARDLESSDDSVESVTPRPQVSGETRSSGTSDLASPRTAASGSTGGGADIPVKLVLVGSANQMCCGVIGKNTKGHFCTRPAGECVIKSHSKKFGVRDNTWYARTPSSRESAVLDISCPASLVTRAEDVEAFRTDSKIAEIWRAVFSSLITRQVIVVDSSSSSDGETVSELGSPTAADFSKAAEDLLSPSSVVMGSAVKSVVDGSVDVPSLETVMDINYDDGSSTSKEQDLDQALGTVLSEWSKIGSNFEKLREMFQTLGVEHEKLSESLLKDFKLVEGKAQLVDNKILLLKERIGQHDIASVNGTKTVWNAIAEIHDELNASNVRIDDMKFSFDSATTLAASFKTCERNVQDLKADYEASMSALDSVLSKVMDRITEVERAGRRDSGVGRFQQFQTTTNPQGVSSRDNRMDPEVERRLKELEKGLREATYPVKVNALNTTVRTSETERARAWEGGFREISALRAGDRVGDNMAAPDGTPVGELIEFFKAELEFLKNKVLALESPHTGVAVEVAGFKFASRNDCLEFIKRCKVDLGTLTDLLTALALMGSKGQTGKDRANEQYAAMRTHTTVLLNDVFAAMDIPRPEKLYAKGGKGDLVPIADGFGAVPSIKEWYGTGVDGAKHTLSIEVRSYVQGLQGVIGTTQTGEAALLARTLAIQTQNHWNELVGFIEQSHTKLVESAKFSEKAAWKLIGRYCTALFEAMRPYRAAVALLVNPESLEDQAALMWAILQCHRIVQDFIKVNFEGHPAIVRETSLFMLTERVDPGQVTRLVEANKELTAEVKVLSKKVKTLEDSGNAMKRTLDNLANEVKQMKKKG